MALPTPVKYFPKKVLQYLRDLGLDPSLISTDGWDHQGYWCLRGEDRRYYDKEWQYWPIGFDYGWFIRQLEMPVEDQVGSFATEVREETDAIAKVLIEKNKAYGNSALDPVRVFSKASAEEQLLVRIDDKISRIQRGHEYADDDSIKDLIGYLILLRIARK